LGLFFTRLVREKGLETLPKILVEVFGKNAGPASTLFTSIGMFLSVIPQVLAFVALSTSMFRVDPFLAAVIAVLLMITYVLFGGVLGTGMVGISKLMLLYFSLITAGFIAYTLTGGFAGLRHTPPAFPWFSLFGRGVHQDLASAFSLLVGVISTQIYLQAIFSGKNVQAASMSPLPPACWRS